MNTCNPAIAGGGRLGRSGVAALFLLAAIGSSLAAAPVRPRPTGKAASDGFVSLFNGRNLDGWQGATDRWSVVDGILVYQPVSKPKGAGDLPTLKLMSAKEYTDFVLRFEFKLAPAANNGVAIRAPLEGDAAFVGMEIQIIDTDGWPAKLKRFQVHGSLYGVAPAKQGHLRPAGEWNREEISCTGRQLKVTLNGAEILNVNLDEARPIDGREHPGLARTKGHIGFLGHTGRVEFRNIEIREVRAP